MSNRSIYDYEDSPEGIAACRADDVAERVLSGDSPPDMVDRCLAYYERAGVDIEHARILMVTPPTSDAS